MTQTKVEAPFVENNAHFKNLIINGDFRIFQRASSSTAVGNGTYSTADRWKTHFSNDGAATSEQHTMSDAERATTGHSFAWQWDVGTADGTIGSGQTCYFRQFIEAQNCSGLAYGSSAAKTLTLSFWVKSAKTGTYSCTLHKHDSTTYNIPLEYAISSADTWEYKTIVITPTAGSTSLITGSAGDIAQDNGKGLILDFWLAGGSEYNGTANTWSATAEHLKSSSHVNWLDSTSNDFYLTGVQLEVGDQATDFEHLPYDVQLQRCQRYCTVFGTDDAFSPFGSGMWKTGTVASLILTFPTKMNHEPTMTIANATASHLRQAGTAPNTSAIALDVSSTQACMYNATVSSGGSAGEGTVHFGDSTTNQKLTFDSEL